MMQLLKKLIDFYIFSNIHVALSGFCLTKITLISYGVSGGFSPLFVGLSILISYNFIRFHEVRTHKINWMKTWFIQNKFLIYTLCFVAVLLLIYIVFLTAFNYWALLVLTPFGVMTLFYVIPIFKFGNMEVSFRETPAIKIFSIAVSWAGVSVLFPLYESGISFNGLVYLDFFQRLLILVAIIIPFDIRDVLTDSKSLKTIPQLVGVVNSKIIGIILLLLFVCIEYLGIQNEYTFLWQTLVIALVTTFFLLFSSEKRTRYYTSFWVEAIPIFWFGLILIDNMLL